MTEAYRTVWKKIGKSVVEHIMHTLAGDSSPMEALIKEFEAVVKNFCTLVGKVVPPTPRTERTLTRAHHGLLSRLGGLYGVSLQDVMDGMIKTTRPLQATYRVSPSENFLATDELAPEEGVTRRIVAKTESGEYVPFSFAALLMNTTQDKAQKVAGMWMPLIGNPAHLELSDKAKEIDTVTQIGRLTGSTIVLLKSKTKGCMFGTVFEKRGLPMVYVGWVGNEMVLLSTTVSKTVSKNVCRTEEPAC